MLKKNIIVTTQFEGIHQYPDAPEEVSYLRVPHRHMFHVQTAIEVNDNNRELEFIMVKHRLERLLGHHTWGPCTSCEDMAEYILKALLLWYGEQRTVQVMVTEDDENGAFVTHRPDNK